VLTFPFSVIKMPHNGQADVFHDHRLSCMLRIALTSITSIFIKKQSMLLFQLIRTHLRDKKSEEL
jgi:hypothetical protein